MKAQHSFMSLEIRFIITNMTLSKLTNDYPYYIYSINVLKNIFSEN